MSSEEQAEATYKNQVLEAIEIMAESDSLYAEWILSDYIKNSGIDFSLPVIRTAFLAIENYK